MSESAASSESVARHSVRKLFDGQYLAFMLEYYAVLPGTLGRYLGEGKWRVKRRVQASCS